MYDRKMKLYKKILTLYVTTHGSNYDIMTMKHIGELNELQKILKVKKNCII